MMVSAPGLISLTSRMLGGVGISPPPVCVYASNISRRLPYWAAFRMGAALSPMSDGCSRRAIGAYQTRGIHCSYARTYPVAGKKSIVPSPQSWVSRLPSNVQRYALLARMDKPIGTLLLFYPCV
ncbi:uncharacterized protein EI90DRAFT_2332130 [Cantharellus anzutake]|uniref:uncharacterized protein n=1 Tax=Cantharellus anzutake TaxID=1750568 RepID=UPI001906CC1A|nr:uncharacterized protein EI90DRAFT_2332130 [Cantharellus anzutake]KAF8324423.1 hypothetical protein EI90DRAFT_2332130 [Cantharellus anzutake]